MAELRRSSTMIQSSAASAYFGSDRLPSEFWEQVHVREDNCWEWMGRKTPNGYGLFRSERTHRLTVALRAPIPHGLVVDHLCHNPLSCRLGDACPHRRCCNPDHLEPVTNEENVRRGGWHLRLPKTATAAQLYLVKRCKRGHLKTGHGCDKCVRMRRAELNRLRDEQRAIHRSRRVPPLVIDDDTWRPCEMTVDEIRFLARRLDGNI